MPVNPTDEINEVRANTGGVGVLNLDDATIDAALTAANDETTERTGLDASTTYKPALRRKFKILVATAYLLLQFKGTKDLSNTINKELDILEKRLALPDLSDTDDETIIDTTDNNLNIELQTEQINYWVGGRRKSIGKARYPGGYYNDLAYSARYGI